MLHLKRASAGSGKTYELAKTYIMDLLTVKLPGKKRVLRPEDSLQEALGGIMAVTFTVKATGEMKQRIVEKLAALTRADSVAPDKIKKVDYLEDLLKVCPSREEIARISRKALSTLLLHFSDFRVQTIDSFFQSILHTFTYEASLDENFNMEIDSDYITSVGFDTALDALSEAYTKHRTGRETLYWIRQLIDRKKGTNQWNVFNRNDSDKTLYNQLKNEAKGLDKEDFQRKKEELMAYFDGPGQNFSALVQRLDTLNYSPYKTLYEARRIAAEELLEELTRAHLSPKDLCYGSSNSNNLMLSLREFSPENLNTLNVRQLKAEREFSLSTDGKKKLKANIKVCPDVNATAVHDIDSAFTAWKAATDSLNDAIAQNSVALETWKAYKDIFPNMMIVLEIARKKREFLEATNTLELSETTHILSRIIGDDETPFVYERMGSRLNHFLIDEFQDTSQMQWTNLRPLLLESEGRGNDNLIIGDAKQSIYRFRNADYRLITEKVEKEFAHSGVVPYTGDTRPSDPERENTNYRSKRNIVEFNNYVFSNIISLQATDKDGATAPVFSPRIQRIYRDSRQALPLNDRGELPPEIGYVEIRFTEPLSKEEEKLYDKVGHESLGEPGYRELPEKIQQLVGRGYRYRDIGILVKTHTEGQVVIKTISQYNDEHPQSQITVISEENLLVGSSLSVKLAIHALEMAAEGLRHGVPENPVLREPVAEEELYELLNSLQSLALPSVVEAVLERFVSPKQRDADAPFIAAFQDAVIDYTASHTSDIGSFLKWWERKGKSLTINSSEETEGVRLLTIHKAKGLEYKCVIIPNGNFKFEPSKQQKEWKWVEPSPVVAGSADLPPFIPVATSQDLLLTDHADVCLTYCEEVALDELNKMYVGFTRAVDELYVYIKENPTASDRTAVKALKTILAQWEDESGTVRYGEPVAGAIIKADTKTKDGNHSVVKNYAVSADIKVLRIQEGNKLLRVPAHTGFGEDELDPRAVGTLKHAVMQMTERLSDLDKALRAMEVNGLVSPRQVKEWGEEIRGAIDALPDKRWFADDVRVLNERSLLMRGEKTVRPDRVVVTKEGDAIVIDYKFGEESGKHEDQVGDYAAKLKETGQFRSVSGYLWYVPEKRVERVV